MDPDALGERHLQHPERIGVAQLRLRREEALRKLIALDAEARARAAPPAAARAAGRAIVSCSGWKSGTCVGYSRGPRRTTHPHRRYRRVGSDRAHVAPRRADRRLPGARLLDPPDGGPRLRAAARDPPQRRRLRARPAPAVVDADGRRDGPADRLHGHVRRPAHRRRRDRGDPDRRAADHGRRDRPLRPLRLGADRAHWPRVVGLVLFAAGAALSLRK